MSRERRGALRVGPQLLQGRRGPQTEAGQGGAATLVDGERQRAAALRRVEPHERRGSLLVGRVGLQAGLPGLQHLFGTGAPDPARAVPGQLEARLLAQVLDPFSHPGRPLGLGLVLEGDPAGREGLDQGGVPSRARRGPQRRVQRFFVGVEVHGQGDGGVGPDLARVGAEQAGGLGAELFQRQPGHRLGLVKRACGAPRATATGTGPRRRTPG